MGEAKKEEQTGAKINLAGHDIGDDVDFGAVKTKTRRKKTGW